MITKSKTRKMGKVKGAFFDNLSIIFELAISLRVSFIKAKYLFPMTAQKLNDATEEDKERIDLLIHRFGKVQDMLGSKIFRGIITLDLEDAGSMKDTINKMEKKYVIENAEDWVDIRDTRNNIIHEYVPRGAEAANTLNEVYELTSELIKIVCNVRNYAEKEFNMDMSKFDIEKLKVN